MLVRPIRVDYAPAVEGTQHAEAGTPARQRILSTAAELFLTNGILAVGVDTVIDRAGVAKATFYRQFASKDDLVVAWLRGPDARWLDEVVAELERRGVEPLRALLEFWDVLAVWSEAHGFAGCPYMNCLIEIGVTDHPARPQIESFVHEVEKFFERTARAGGLSRPLDWALRERTLTMGALIAIMLERSRAPMERGRGMTADLMTTWSREASP
jgi:AcrR family transcriptional regulator